MKVLILGGTGLLGLALGREARARAHTVITAARSGADLTFDAGDETALRKALDDSTAGLVINAAAMVSHAACEADPAAAWRINARPARVLADWSRETGRPFVHISTDHYFDGDGEQAHPETAPVTLVNEYARSKHAGEQYALAAPEALVLRTAIAGFHPDGRGFAAWAFSAMASGQPMTLFEDYYGSVIDTGHFAAALFDLQQGGARGLYNLAGAQVSSKADFIRALAAAAGLDLRKARPGSARGLVPRRALSLGLDVRKAENALGRALPGRQTVCAALAQQWRQLP